MALAKKYRLTGKKDFQSLFYRGHTIKSDFLIVKFLKNNLKHPRIAITVPLKISKKAVIRNKIRRLIAEVVRKINYQSRSIDMIIISSPSIVDKSFEEIKRDLESIINAVTSQ